MSDRKRYGVVVAARWNSSRLPGKALLDLSGQPSLQFLFRRLAGMDEADVTILATTERADDDALAEVARQEGLPVIRGATDDVVGRFVKTATDHHLDYVVRITADCPFLDAATIDHCIDQCRAAEPFELMSTKGSFPVGIDVEVYPADRMRELHESRLLGPAHREHLTLYLYESLPESKQGRLHPPADLPHSEQEFTLDTAEDLERLDHIATKAGGVTAPVAALVEAAAR